MNWDYNLLFNKAIYYLNEAEKFNKDDTMRPLLHSFSLELLCKSALSFIHPTLIADPQDEGQSLMYALELNHRGQPKSLPAHSVYKRAEQLIESFTDSERKFCEFFSSKRNEELHTGSSPMSSLKENSWLPNFYYVSKILCEHIEKDISDLLGNEDIGEIIEIIENQDKNVEASVRNKIGSHKSVWQSKNETAKNKLINNGEIFYKSKKKVNTTLSICPCCENNGLLVGKEIQQKEPKYNGTEFYAETIFQSTNFICKICDLEFDNLKHIQIANIEIRFAKFIPLDLHEFYLPEYEFEYDNM